MAKKKATHVDANEREQIIFGRNYDPENYKAGGVCRFNHLDLEKVLRLVDKGYLSPEDTQNYSPKAGEFIRFVQEHNPALWSFHGYVVSRERDDSRVTIEGIESNTPIPLNDLLDFLVDFRFADELNAEENKPVYCWYD